MYETERCIVTFVDRLLKGDVRPFDTVIATIRIEPEVPSEEFVPDKFYHMIFHTRSNYMLVMGAESKGFIPEIGDKFTVQSHHDSAWRMDGFSEINKISWDAHKVWLEDVKFLNLENNPISEFGSDEWNSTFSVDTHQKTITRNK